MIESDPPLAKNLAVGCISTDKHEDVCPFKVKACEGSKLMLSIGLKSG